MTACRVDKESSEIINFVKAQHQALLQQLERAFADLELQPFDSGKGQQDDLEQSGPNAPSALSTTQPHAQGDSDSFAEDPDDAFKPSELELKIGVPSQPAALTDETWGSEVKSEFSPEGSDYPVRRNSSPRDASKNLKNILMGSDLNLARTSEHLYRLGPYLDGIAVIMVLLNALVLALEAQLEGESKGSQLHHESATPVYSDYRPVFQILDFTFDVFFILEFGVLAYIYLRNLERPAFLEIAAMFFMVVVSLVEMGLFVCHWMGVQITDHAFHVVHAVTCLRILRCLKALQHFKGPRLLLTACNSFLHSLFWGMIFLVIFMLSGALCLANLMFSFFRSRRSLEDKIFIWDRYGTTFRSWYTLYEITFSGSWPSSTRPVIEKVRPGLVIFFVVYITVIAFGLIRVITAVFLRDTLDAAASDAEEQVADQMKKKEEYARKLEEIFSTIDTDGKGLLTEDQLSEALRYPKIRAYFQTLELDVHESKALFHILDDGDGTVTLSEFITGLLRCKGQARAIDQVAAHTEIKHLDKKVSQVLSLLEGMNSTPPSSASCSSHASRPPSFTITNHLAAFGQGPPAGRTTIRLTT